MAIIPLLKGHLASVRIGRGNHRVDPGPSTAQRVCHLRLASVHQRNARVLQAPHVPQRAVQPNEGLERHSLAAFEDKMVMLFGH